MNITSLSTDVRDVENRQVTVDEACDTLWHMHTTPPNIPSSTADDDTQALATQGPTSTSLKLPVVLMAWPAVSLIVVFALYALNQYLLQASSPAASGELFTPSNTGTVVFNLVLFFIGALSVALGPISFILGVVVFVTRRRAKKIQQPR